MKTPAERVEEMIKILDKMRKNVSMLRDEDFLKVSELVKKMKYN